MTSITVAIQLPNPFHVENVQRDLLRAVRTTGATATPIADGQMGGSLIEILPQILDVAADGATVAAMYNAIKSIADCLRVYKEAQLKLQQAERTATMKPAMSDAEREDLLRKLILDTDAITVTVTPLST